MKVLGLNEKGLSEFNIYINYIKEETKKYLDIDLSFDYNIILYEDINDFYKGSDTTPRNTLPTNLMKQIDNNLHVYISPKHSLGFYKLAAKKLVELELSKYIKDHTFIEGFSVYVTDFNSSNHKIYNKFKVWYLNKIARRDKFIPTAAAIKDKTYQGYENYAFLIAIYLVRNFNLKDGQIINSDYITDEFIRKVIEHFDKLFGVYDIKKNFYDIETPEELLDYLCLNMIYGYVDENGNKHYDLRDIKNTYKTGNINKSLETLMGTCLENTNLEKYWFTNHGYKNYTLVWRKYENDDNYKMHSFLIYQDKKTLKWNYFEYTKINKAGIYEFNSLEDAILYYIHEYSDKRELIVMNELTSGLTFKEFNEDLNNMIPCEYEMINEKNK